MTTRDSAYTILSFDTIPTIFYGLCFRRELFPPPLDTALCLGIPQRNCSLFSVDTSNQPITTLIIIIAKFKGGPVGLNTLSAALSEEQSTIEDIYEPFLIQLGFLERTQRGRIATENAYSHLGFEFNSAF